MQTVHVLSPIEEEADLRPFVVNDAIEEWRASEVVDDNCPICTDECNLNC